MAEDAYRTGLAGEPSPALANRLARVLLRTAGRDPDRTKEAMRLAEQTLAAGVRDPLPHLQTLALAYDAAGLRSEADRVRHDIERVELAGR